MSNEINTTDEYIEITAENRSDFVGKYIEVKTTSRRKSYWTEAMFSGISACSNYPLITNIGTYGIARIKNPNYKPVEQVEQNETEKLINYKLNAEEDYETVPISVLRYIGIMEESIEQLLAEKEELKKINTNLKNLIRKDAQYMENSISLKNLNSEERQKLKDYAQKLRDERVETEQYYKVMGDYECVRYLTKNKEWGDSSSCTYGVDFKSFKIIKRLYTADELEGK